jgi:hypothetical protein
MKGIAPPALPLFRHPEGNRGLEEIQFEQLTPRDPNFARCAGTDCDKPLALLPSRKFEEAYSEHEVVTDGKKTTQIYCRDCTHKLESLW